VADWIVHKKVCVTTAKSSADGEKKDGAKIVPIPQGVEIRFENGIDYENDDDDDDDDEDLYERADEISKAKIREIMTGQTFSRVFCGCGYTDRLRKYRNKKLHSLTKYEVVFNTNNIKEAIALIDDLMTIKHCAMFDWGNLYAYKMDGTDLHLNFDTKSG